MIRILTLPERLLAKAETADGLILGTLGRLVFAAVLLGYFWASALTKLGDGLFGWLFPSVGAYAQIFPRKMEAVGYDTSQLGIFEWAVVVAGTWAEFLLPLLIVLGLFTRTAALGSIIFLIVQTLTDLYGHGLATAEGGIGALFDRMPDSAIPDQRVLWVFLLLVLVVKGAGPLSLDRLIERRAQA